jgi:Lon protease-like protein
MFPHVVQPLYIFEPRYKQMLEDILAGDKIMAMALLKPGYECTYVTKHCPIYNVVCLGKVLTQQKLPDGNYHLLLKGLSRASILNEIETADPYRIANVEITPGIDDIEPQDRCPMVRKIRDMFCRTVSAGILKSPPKELLPEHFSLEMLCDMVSYALKIPMQEGQAILETPRLSQRCQIVLEHLQHKINSIPSDAPRPIPPTDCMN